MANNIVDLYSGSKKNSLIILAITAIIFSRGLFFFFNDPEGPNLLIIAGLTLAVYLFSVAAYLFIPFKIDGIKRLAVVICIQILLVFCLYFCLK